MKNYGLQKTTLLDYPGHVAAAIFLEGCNFRCPFCHNSALLDEKDQGEFTEEELFHFLKKRRNILDGVCITGGEPTLFSGLETLIGKIRSLGFLIKLDTNGYRPKVLKSLCTKGLLDYVAMDIKAGRDNYKNACGLPSVHIDQIEESASFLMEGTIPYEFRTTVVNGIHTVSDFEDIGKWLAGSSQYFLQNFVDSGQVLKSGFTSFSREELEGFSKILSAQIPAVSLRGID